MQSLHCTRSLSVAAATCQPGQGSCWGPRTPPGRLRLECGLGALRLLRTCRLPKSHRSNENADARRAVGNALALDELLVRSVFLGRGCCEGAGEPSSLVCRVAFSGGLTLGGTWPSLKGTHLH